MCEGKKKHNRGITLIALIITVVILLILTGATVGIAFESNFFGKAQNSVNEASRQRTEQVEKEGEAIETWDEVPGNMIKSST